VEEWRFSAASRCVVSGRGFSRAVKRQRPGTDLSGLSRCQPRGSERIQLATQSESLRFVILSAGARFAFGIALRSRRTPCTPAPAQAQKGIHWLQPDGAESSWSVHHAQSERNGCPISGRSCRKRGFSVGSDCTAAGAHRQQSSKLRQACPRQGTTLVVPWTRGARDAHEMRRTPAYSRGG